jgi:hypothetical protein
MQIPAVSAAKHNGAGSDLVLNDCLAYLRFGRYWPMTSDSALRKYFWTWGLSGHETSSRRGPRLPKRSRSASIYVVCAAVHSAASRIGEPNCSRGISLPQTVQLLFGDGGQDVSGQLVARQWCTATSLRLARFGHACSQAVWQPLADYERLAVSRSTASP